MTAIEPPALRPLTLSQLLDRAIRLYRQNFLVFVGIVAIALVPVTILQYVLQLAIFDDQQRALSELGPGATPLEMLASGGSMTGIIVGLVVALVTFILVSCFATGALSKAIEDSYLGRAVSIVGSYRRIGGVLFSLLIAMVVAVILVIVLWLWVIVPCVGWLTGPGLILFFTYVIFPLVPAIVVIEKQGPLQAISRAWELTRRRFWWVLGFVIVLGILSWITRAGPTLLVTAFSGSIIKGLMPLADAQAQFAVEYAISQAVTFLFQLIYLPIQMTAIILMYFDLRVRTEGFDLVMLAASTDEAEAVAEKTPDAPPADNQPPITLNEAGYFAAISVGLLLICGIVYGLFFVIAMASIGALQQGF